MESGISAHDVVIISQAKEEAQAAQSRADFRSKMSIAAKEARETHYWLRLTRDGQVLDRDRVKPLIDEIETIKRILTSIVKSSGE